MLNKYSNNFDSTHRSLISLCNYNVPSENKRYWNRFQFCKEEGREGRTYIQSNMFQQQLSDMIF